MLALPLTDDTPVLLQFSDVEVHIYCLPFGFFMIIAHLHSGALSSLVQDNMLSVRFHLDFTGVRGLPGTLLSTLRPIELLGR
jgi:hypothetical protein